MVFGRHVALLSGGPLANSFLELCGRELEGVHVD